MKKTFPTFYPTQKKSVSWDSKEPGWAQTPAYPVEVMITCTNILDAAKCSLTHIGY